ncbi:hypothetical protein BU24DRAFT_469106 [Aaosphaeria arxii CBS 175.79]|uniref:Uncharacterized protein n=1 Tax=Aaosphaeria arxii CBS 175.79 TaxID=1450172 RepID=A0A6A5X5Z8_9PLEO|nr:uncharacterized protein BU24DRAFT_469106 [Aaosphaeria arxii CBS 175.79]KAF2008267.1 hypothetical protein BU24DRAFT_469106 [Aaosphaeria arxii CBS 175.79]
MIENIKASLDIWESNQENFTQDQFIALLQTIDRLKEEIEKSFKRRYPDGTQTTPPRNKRKSRATSSGRVKHRRIDPTPENPIQMDKISADISSENSQRSENQDQGSDDNQHSKSGNEEQSLSHVEVQSRELDAFLFEEDSDMSEGTPEPFSAQDIAEWMELAQKIKFCLPNEFSLPIADGQETMEELLLPLFQASSLSSRLICGILYCVLPGIQVIDFTSREHEITLCQEFSEIFVAVELLL